MPRRPHPQGIRNDRQPRRRSRTAARNATAPYARRNIIRPPSSRTSGNHRSPDRHDMFFRLRIGRNPDRLMERPLLPARIVAHRNDTLSSGRHRFAGQTNPGTRARHVGPQQHERRIARIFEREFPDDRTAFRRYFAQIGVLRVELQHRLSPKRSRPQNSPKAYRKKSHNTEDCSTRRFRQTTTASGNCR